MCKINLFQWGISCAVSGNAHTHRINFSTVEKNFRSVCKTPVPRKDFESLRKIIQGEMSGLELTMQSELSAWREIPRLYTIPRELGL